MKETDDDINKWEDIPRSWTGRINTVKMTILRKAINRLNAIYKIMAFSTDLEQKILKPVWRNKRLQGAKASLKKKTGAGGIGLTDFSLYNKATVIKQL